MFVAAGSVDDARPATMEAAIVPHPRTPTLRGEVEEDIDGGAGCGAVEQGRGRRARVVLVLEY
jgi:hypothetical protein